MAKTGTVDWAANFARPASVGSAAVPESTEERVGEPVKSARKPRKPASVGTPRKTGKAVTGAPAPVLARPPAKRAVTYRLTDEVLDLVDLAVAVATEKGERLSKEDAVANAIRKAYGRLAR